MERFLHFLAIFGALAALLQLGRGLSALVSGRVATLPGLLGGGKVIRGWRARLVGAVFLLPIPLALATGGEVSHWLGLTPDPGQARADLWAGYEEYKRARADGEASPEARKGFKAQATPFVRVYGIELALFTIGLSSLAVGVVETFAGRGGNSRDPGP